MKQTFRIPFIAVAFWVSALAPAAFGAANYTLWPNTTVPAVADTGPDNPVELGVKFKSDQAGTIAGIRFYKSAANTGTHVANLWDQTGTRLATATFAQETASGWQQVLFSPPVNIAANKVYVASYHTSTGHYSDDLKYFAGKTRDNPPLHALADGTSGFNGVFAYGTGSSFPSQGWNSSNYWVDLIFVPSVADTTPPTVTAFTVPATATSLTVYLTSFTATDNVAVTGYLVNESPNLPAVDATGWSAAPATSYSFTSAGNKQLYAWAKDAAGNISASLSASVSVSTTGDRPILIVTSNSNPFSSYYTEILGTEGFNSFAQADLASVTATLLAGYDLVLLGEMPLSPNQVTLFTNWVTGGGHLVAMHPDKKLASLLGLTDQGGTLSDGYLLIDTSSGPGQGISGETLQFHGSADLYAANGATVLAKLYADATKSTPNPAVSFRPVGTKGGTVAAFAYDLARSVVYTRQGNPAWSGDERDGQTPIRSDDLFFGPAVFDQEPNWVDFNRVAIPQADEQQRLLANLIIQMNLDKKPLPRFWYLPRGEAAVVVMTGDDHANGGTAGRFDRYLALSPPNCSLANWECIRGTSYLYPNAPLTNTQAASYTAAGFEVALHVFTNCADWTPSTLDGFFSDQLTSWASRYSSLPLPQTNRTHCIVWSDYASQPQIELRHGIRLDTNYYYWPPTWVNNVPGFFTGSGMPMRFADLQGHLIDVYQAATQMTDESGQSYPYTIDTLLDRATGPQGYYGVFVVNAHTDLVDSDVSDAVVYSALAHGVPVISAKQLLTWLDGRNASSFSGFSWNGTTLSFAVSAGSGANGLTVAVPIPDGKTVQTVTAKGSTIPFALQRIKGIPYATFTASSGNYQVTFSSDRTPPSVTGVTPASGTVGVPTTAAVSAQFSEALDGTSVSPDTFSLRSGSGIAVPAAVTYDAVSRTATLTPSAPLANSTSYTATVEGGAAGVKDVVGNVLPGDYSWSFSTAASGNGPFSLFNAGATPRVVDTGPDAAVELGVKFRSDSAGYITGIRFYKAATNTGVHVGNLWSISGKLLASVTFPNETPSGWQQATFPAPVAVTANTTYVASYHTVSGHYSVDQSFFSGKGADNVPLHAPADGTNGFNGVFAYGATSIFPSQGYLSSNYWVDVLFSTATP
ncbi:DUF4082 domain-containing protein [Geomesophilobacter sediminis]|uniref:DUF4082 domain-containing protein n=1 Tax=Geomesophilobacter sediminis TaxID=2798584 RepID=A0A8J7M2C9_9BACT|nr:DUF4082 domain-containing protein [Geomesophilobacter sediminis]MBJ6727239.1 DUF4082 domain-containing protein [Geomesophilobacter sediminis]